MYTDEDIGKLFDGWHETTASLRDLIEKYVVAAPKLTELARPHAVYGICRRLSVINDCIDYFFSEMPPNLNHEQERHIRGRANIHLHTFLINICGITDNMAWLWVYHINLNETVNLENKKYQIGLFKKAINQYFPETLQIKIAEYTNWFNFVFEHRNPTAHRIPPYIIPYTTHDESDPPESRDYTPMYFHSGEESRAIHLHPQTLTDANTITSLLETMHSELLRED